MIKPVVIIADDAPKDQLEGDLYVWDESIFRENAAALGNDINFILVTSDSQKIDDLVPKVKNLTAVITTGPAVDKASLASNTKLAKAANLAEAIATIQKASD